MIRSKVSYRIKSKVSYRIKRMVSYRIKCVRLVLMLKINTTPGYAG